MITTLVRTDRPTISAAAAAKSAATGHVAGAGVGSGEGAPGRAGLGDYLERLDLVSQEALLSDMRSLVKQFADTVKVRAHPCVTPAQSYAR